jgi:hypothetical protein
VQKFIAICYLLLAVLSCAFTVNVVTNPGNVEIRQGNIIIAETDRSGMASFEISLPATITFSKPGYLSKQIFISDQPGTYHIILTPVTVLKIDSKPIGADIFLNGKFIGTTPKETEIIPGRYILQIEKDGFCRLTEKIEIDSLEKKELFYELKKIPDVKILSKPPSHVWIDGKFAGKTPVELNIEKGKHLLVLKAENFFDLQAEIFVENEQEQTFNFSLTPSARLRITAVPQHALVKINEDQKNQPAEFYTDLSQKLITVSADGYKTQQIVFQPDQGENNLHVILEPDIKELTIDAPADAVIFVDGKSVSRGSVKLKLSGDIHWVEAQLGEKKWAGIVDLTKNQSLKINFDYATLILLGKYSIAVEGVTYIPPAITYLPAGFHTIEINSDPPKQQTKEFKSGSLDIISLDSRAYLNIFSELVVPCYIDSKFIGLSPVLFYPLEPGVYSIKTGEKEEKIEVPAGQLLGFR